MKIYLLDRNFNMIREWEKYFYDVPNVEIVYDDFENFMKTHKVDCVVSPANSFGLMDGGYDLAISKWFGEGLMESVQSYIINNYYGEQPVATSFTLDSTVEGVKLIHTPTMREPDEIKEPLVVYQCMRTTLIEAIKNNIQEIVIPSFGGGTGCLKHEIIAKMMYQGYMQVMNYKAQNINWGNHITNKGLFYDKIYESDLEIDTAERSPYYKIIVGDIVSDEIINLADAVVLPSNPMMRYGSGVSGAIFKKAGVDVLEAYAMKKYKISYESVSRENEMKIGEVRITPGFGVPADILWVCGPCLWDYSDNEYMYAESLLLQTYSNLLQYAFEQGYSSIVIPSIGTGSYGFSHQMVGKKVSLLIDKFLKEIEGEYFDDREFRVYLVLLNEEDIKYY